MKLIIFEKIFFKKNLIIFLAIYLLSNYITAQYDFNIHSFTTEDGLPTNSIYNIEEDKDGFIWLMSNSSLTRFDGIKFVNYQHKNCKEGNINNYHKSTYKIKRAGIEGVLFYNKSKNCIEKITRIGDIYFDTESKVIYSDSSQTWLCMSDRKKIIIFNKKNFKIVDSIILNTKISGHPFAFYNGSIFLGTSDNSFFLSYNTSTRIENQISFSKYLFKNHLITTHNFLNYEYKMITGSWGDGLLVYNSKNNKVDKYINNKYNCFRDICFAPKLTGDSIIWCADAFSGISLFDIKHERFVKNIVVGETKNNLISNSIYDIFYDSRGCLWIASQAGVSLINPLKQFFQIKDFKNEWNFHDNNIKYTTNTFQYLNYKHKIIFRTALNELKIYNKNINKIEKSIHFNHNAIYHSDINENAHGIYSDYLFIGDRDTLHYINILNNNHQKICLPLNSTISNRFVQIIKYYGGDHVWIGTNVGLYKIDLKLKKIILSYTDENGLLDNDVNDILLKNNELYLASNEGINVINIANNSIKSLKNKNKPSDDILLNLQKDNNGDIWANYLHYGFLKICKDDVTESYPINYPKSNISIFNFHIDSSGRFWLLTDIGLLCFDRQANKIKSFNEFDGLPKNNYNSLSEFFFINKQYIGISGIGSKYVEFEPNSTIFDTSNMLLKIVQISNNEINIPFDQSQKLILNYDQNTLSFLLSAKDFNQYKKLNARYRLNSIDSNWINLEASNSINFPKLEPGNYFLEMQVSNFESFDNIKSSYFQFQIKPPFWNTWYAYMFYFIVIFLFLYKIYIININQKNMKIKNQELVMEHENQLKLERNRIASEMHDDIGGGLSTIKFLSEIAITSNTEYEKNIRLEKIALTSKDLIENMGDIIWVMNIQNDNIESLIAQIRSFASEFAENNNLKLKLELMNCSNNFIINGVKRRNIYLCIKEVFHNIKKHSYAKNVHLSIDIQKNIKIKILDDGIFFNLNTVKLGNGIMNMQQRMRSIGGNLQIKFENGTLIELEIPI